MSWKSLDKNDRREKILNTLLGILSALLIAELIYQQPPYENLVTSGDFSAVTKDGENLGRAFSTLYVRYHANPWGTSLGEFTFPVRTQLVEEPDEIKSVLLKDIVYEVSLWWRDGLIERKCSHYLGSISTEEGTCVLFNVLFMTKIDHPMTELKRVYGPITIKVTGRFYNQTSGETISSGQIDLPIFILYPYTRLTTFSILFLIIFLKILGRRNWLESYSYK